ncbi:uncharacterized protein QYS62_006485 [Fusarium acuminatum]|uniref:Uncharacterized protein n=1 Tax=Fusarium acuminatum TaxID=5515 RepID=A0ABZ2X0B2_9HYPO
MKFSLPLVAGLAASVAAHPQNGKKASVTTSTTAVPTSAKGQMPSLPFLPTWLFRDAGNKGQGQGIENGLKCISTYNNCLVKSTNVVDCASAYGSCVKSGSSATGSTTISATSSATLTTKSAALAIPSVTGAPTRTFARPQIPSVSGLAKWWKHEQGVRKCNYAYYTCRRAKDSNQDSCRSDRTACIAAAKASASASNTAAATSVPTTTATATATTATSAITTSATDSASSATTAASSTTAVVAASVVADADAPLDSDDASFDDDSLDADA